MTEREQLLDLQGRKASSKSWTALRWTCADFAPRYLWTFTLKERIPVHVAARMWSRLWSNVLRREGFKGVRVFELHPGGHGLHVHFLCADFHHVNAVRRALRTHADGQPWGTGRGVDVCKVHGSSGWEYAAKYVSKGLRCPELKGLRLWARCAIVGCLVRCVEIDTGLSRVVKAAFVALRSTGFKALRLGVRLWERVGERGARLYLRGVARLVAQSDKITWRQRYDSGLLPGLARVAA